MLYSGNSGSSEAYGLSKSQQTTTAPPATLDDVVNRMLYLERTLRDSNNVAESVLASLSPVTAGEDSEIAESLKDPATLWDRLIASLDGLETLTTYNALLTRKTRDRLYYSEQTDRPKAG